MRAYTYQEFIFRLNESKVTLDMFSNITEENVKTLENWIQTTSDINAQNEKGNTALILSIIYVVTRSNIKYVQHIIELLLDASADVNIRNNEGDTALIWAAIRNNPYVLELLIEAGADISIKNNEQKNALDYALLNNRHECIKILKNPEEILLRKKLNVKSNNTVVRSGIF